MDPFTDSQTSELVLTWDTIALRLAVASVYGLLVAASYCGAKQRGLSANTPLATTLVLLTVLVAMTAIVIGESTARAFSLVGALSIVRFRTAMEDARDTAFVVFAVVAGMAVGSGNLTVCAVGIPLISLIAVSLHWVEGLWINDSGDQRLDVRIGSEQQPATLFAAIFEAYFQSAKLVQVVTAQKGVSLDLRYQVRLRDVQKTMELVRELQKLDGVQNVEMKDAN